MYGVLWCSSFFVIAVFFIKLSLISRIVLMGRLLKPLW